MLKVIPEKKEYYCNACEKVLDLDKESYIKGFLTMMYTTLDGFIHQQDMSNFHLCYNCAKIRIPGIT